MESKLSPERAFFCLSPEGKPSGRRPMAALPRREEDDKVSYCVRGIVAKRNLFPITLAKRLADFDTIGNKAAHRVRNMDGVSVTQHDSNEEPPSQAQDTAAERRQPGQACLSGEKAG